MNQIADSRNSPESIKISALTCVSKRNAFWRNGFKLQFKCDWISIVSVSINVRLTTWLFCSAALLMLNWHQLYLLIWLHPNQLNRRPAVQWCFPLCVSVLCYRYYISQRLKHIFEIFWFKFEIVVVGVGAWMSEALMHELQNAWDKVHWRCFTFTTDRKENFRKNFSLSLTVSYSPSLLSLSHILSPSSLSLSFSKTISHRKRER